MYLSNLYAYDWVLTKSPAGAQQWTPKDGAGKGTVPDAHDKSKSHAPMMFTTDIALKMDPAYAKITKRFLENPKEFEQAFAKAWFKLTHRDMGPLARYHGPEIPKENFDWQDPVPAVDHELVNAQDISKLKAQVLDSSLSTSELVATAWASASTFRGSDKRGGANGARIRLAPMKDWEVNNPAQLAKVLAALEKIQSDFNKVQTGNKKVSLADLIVLAGNAAIESAAKKAGHDVSVPFTPGRTDATQDMSDVDSLAYLEPKHDGFRNYLGHELDRPAPENLVDRGVLTQSRGALTNDFFVNLLNMDTEWKVSPRCEHFYEGTDRKTGQMKWMATSVDLVFGSNSQLRAIAEVYATDDNQAKFVTDFIAAWSKVTNLDRFDLSK
jgi:catalase-peroxidase